ncbi:MAG: bifunctional glutamate N-acetyltransferase/amino-acid acetyltransferase ArgJ [Kiritimatiellae bacterium]|nr:bifunctional glutamate N-acetyltransferase/amino-acid acetyltransferase ArgJ [Kiritimatiellia bacterium]MDD5521222.1 bifunctional glutamate N-acetyltransferase/amino-acid acetyltransferase ArgJ [Kiritimatiellia bacterium]
MSAYEVISGGITAPKGYRASGVQAGIKYPRPDMAMIVSDKAAVIAGTFTRNKIQGAHIKFCRERLIARKAQAIVVNSGCANACVGTQGLLDARKMAKLTAASLGINEKYVFVCSTGTIGIPLPMDKIETGIAAAAESLSSDGGNLAAKAIMTTDTVDKQFAVECKINGIPVKIGGMAKGAGMIEPNMATMLAFMTTDAAVEAKSLQTCLSDAVAESFNRISVDGDQSCNDTVLFMANGCAGNTTLDVKHPEWSIFRDAVGAVAKELALKVVRDGEGATKFVTVTVCGAVSNTQARMAARAIANSLLVKTSWFGGDPNWGRIIDAIGYSGAEVIEDRVNISFDELMAVKGGKKSPNVSIEDMENVIAKKSFAIEVNLNLGKGKDIVYTCDCSEEYVKINAEYMT